MLGSPFERCVVTNMRDPVASLDRAFPAGAFELNFSREERLLKLYRTREKQIIFKVNMLVYITFKFA